MAFSFSKETNSTHPLDSEHPAGTRYYIACGESEVEGRNGLK